MKKMTMLMLAASTLLFTGCVLGIRSNMYSIDVNNKATTAGSIRDRSAHGTGAPAVNADATRTYSDMLNNSGNGNGQGATNNAAPQKEA